MTKSALYLLIPMVLALPACDKTKEPDPGRAPPKPRPCTRAR